VTAPPTVCHTLVVRLFRRDAPATPEPAPRSTVPPRGEMVAIDGLPAAFACLAVITQTAQQATIGTVRGGIPTDTPAWLRHPEELNRGLTVRDLIGDAVAAMASRGLGAWWAIPVGTTSWALAPLHPDRVTVQFTAAYTRVWSVDGAPATLADGATRTGGIMPFGYLYLPRQAEPVGPLQAARLVGRGYIDTETFASNIFRTGAGTGPRMETDADLPQDTAARWRDYWVEQHGDPSDPRMPVLGAGLRIATDLIDPETAAWVEARQYNAGEIARLFRVPASRLDLPSGGSLVYQTARDNDAAFMRHTISAYLGPIADALTRLLPTGVNATEDETVRFDWSALLTPTPADLLEYVTAAVTAGVMTTDEGRAMLGLEPLGLTLPTLEPVAS
jgi:HK97 family phage portal protein